MDKVNHVVAVDLGGTNIRATRFFLSGGSWQMGEVLRADTPQTEEPTDVLREIAGLVNRLKPENGSYSVGICSPGPLNPFTGEVFATPNIMGFKTAGRTQARSWLENDLGASVVIDNDANAAGLAEAKHGAAKGCKTVVYYTWSTGIGGAVIVDDKLIYGRDGAAGEIGHVCVRRPSIPVKCGCGFQHASLAHLEAVASGTGIVNQANVHRSSGVVEYHSCEEVFGAAQEGRSSAITIVNDAIDAMGQGIAGVIQTINPDIVVIGGGISKQGDRVFNPLRARVAELLMSKDFETPIVQAVLEEPGLWGALELALAPPVRPDKQ